MTAPFLTRCRECGGNGFVPDARRIVHTCDDCDGTGSAPPDPLEHRAPWNAPQVRPELAPAEAYETDPEAQGW